MVLRSWPLPVSGVVADAPVVGVAAVAHRDIQHAVRAEIDPVAVMVELRPMDRRDDALVVRVGDVRIVLGDPHLGDHVGVRVPQMLGDAGAAEQRRAVGDVEQAVVLEVRMEGHAEQALFVEELPLLDDLVLDVQEILVLQLAVGPQDLDRADLLDDEAALAAVRRREQLHRMRQARGYGLQLRFQCRSTGAHR